MLTFLGGLITGGLIGAFVISILNMSKIGNVLYNEEGEEIED